MNWIECQGCGEEFRVICDSAVEIKFCPICGDEVELEEDEDYEEDYD